ncbi:baeRF3 domain-containing protein [Desulfuribacillus alkaliarsenatis]|uniref:Uncharacterized protein n=1 Tax=Desulfuribacillus alkaliarsenatis TaxID=766136 RepID=A0A1E5G387_9FIRM|nr:hypothetical protein [Desulfuribacillus alkaliarsenatis]OEF97537.1 hypothetical protein BHF68_04850 [Desulfuribacillus alkaliarsenatis]
MSIITREEIKRLVNEDNEIYISLYMPTGITGADAKQGQIRLKNVLRAAQDQLIEHGYKKPGIEEMTDSVQKLIDNTLFWSYQGGGLAVFLSEKGMCYYQLPVEVPELAVVSDGYHLKPLMQLLTEDGHFYILSLNQKHVRLFSCSKHFASELHLEDVPTDIETYLKYDDPEKQLQFSTHTPGGGGAVRAASYHGHSVSDEEKTNLLRFFQEIDKGVRKTINDTNAPMVLAGVEYYLPIYREANKYNGVVADGVIGSTEQMQLKEMHEHSWNIVEPIFSQKRKEATDRYNEFKGTGRTLNDVEEIIRAAYAGRIETLFVALHEQASPDNRDLLNDAAIQAYIQGGAVYVIGSDEAPDKQEVAAVLRY